MAFVGTSKHNGLLRVGGCSPYQPESACAIDKAQKEERESALARGMASASFLDYICGIRVHQE